MILIVGATGVLGGLIARQLLEQGKPVRILVRRNSPADELAKQGRATSARSLIDAGAQPIYGDLTDRNSLDAACAGVETVIATVTAAGRDGDFERVDRRGTQNLIDAAKDAGVEHFIYTSAVGSEPNHPHPLFRAKGQSEAYLKESGLIYTILNPGVFMEIWITTVVGMPLQAGRPVTLVGEGARQQAFVSVADVAAYAVAVVDNPTARNQTIPIAGPASHSWTEVVEAVGRAVGRTIPVNYAAPGEPIPLLPEGLGAMLAGMEMTGTDMGDTTEMAKRYQIEPTSLDAFVQRTFGASMH